MTDIIKKLESFLIGKKLIYELSEESGIKLGFKTDNEDLPVRLSLYASDEDILFLFSPMGFSPSPLKTNELLIAINEINSQLYHGKFVYSLSGEDIYFENSKFCGNGLSDDEISFLIGLSRETVERYEKVLFDVNSGKISAYDFVKAAN